VEVDNTLGDPVVDHLIALVDQNEEQIKAGHDGRAHVYVVAERLAPVVLAIDWIGGGQNTGARIQRRLNAGLGDRNGLLFHGLVDGHLIQT